MLTKAEVNQYENHQEMHTSCQARVDIHYLHHFQCEEDFWPPVGSVSISLIAVNEQAGLSLSKQVA